MSILLWIVVMTTCGAALSVSAAALFALTARAAWLPLLVSYAIGALLGAAFLEVLPDAIQASSDAATSAGTVLFGILGFFILEKLVIWRHCHMEACEAHEPKAAGDIGHAGYDGGRSGLMILVGNTFHNFVDGILIAAAFMGGVNLGIVTAIAIITHEIPQQVGDFMILLHSGFARGKALAFNLLSSAAMIAGGLLAYSGLSAMQSAVPVFLALAAASMIYVAVADLIPGLHKHPQLSATLHQVLLIVAGIATIWFAHRLVESLVG